MNWTKYKCVVDKYGIITKGQEFITSGEKAKDMDGNTLDIDTKFVKRHSCPESGDSYDFEYLGEVSGIVGDDVEEEPKAKSSDEELAKQGGGKIIVIVDDGDICFYDDLEVAKKAAEDVATSNAIVAEVVCELKIKKITKWES